MITVDLRKITFLLIVSFIASFLMRTIGTLFPLVFQNAYLAKGTIAVNTFFIVVQLFFYVYFLREYVLHRQKTLRTGSILAIIGSLLVAFVYIKHFCIVFEVAIIPLSLMNHHFDAIFPLASSLLYMLFFGIFKKVQSQKEYRMLDQPLSLAIIGIAIFIVLHLIVLINFLKFHTFNWLEHMPRNIAVGTLPLIIFAALFILYFYIKFYKFLCLYGNKR